LREVTADHRINVNFCSIHLLLTVDTNMRLNEHTYICGDRCILVPYR
jgi:hypothetical protein